MVWKERTKHALTASDAASASAALSGPGGGVGGSCVNASTTPSWSVWPTPMRSTSRRFARSCIFCTAWRAHAVSGCDSSTSVSLHAAFASPTSCSDARTACTPSTTATDASCSARRPAPTAPSTTQTLPLRGFFSSDADDNDDDCGAAAAEESAPAGVTASRVVRSVIACRSHTREREKEGKERGMGVGVGGRTLRWTRRPRLDCAGRVGVVGSAGGSSLGGASGECGETRTIRFQREVLLIASGDGSAGGKKKVVEKKEKQTRHDKHKKRQRRKKRSSWKTEKCKKARS